MTSDECQWIDAKVCLPAENLVVLTKIDDGHGVRNCSRLKLFGNLWYVPSGDMYVYYTPTHWAYDEPTQSTRRTEP